MSIQSKYLLRNFTGAGQTVGTGRIGFYGLFFSVFLGIWMIALGGGLWDQLFPWQHRWTYLLFADLCHQDPGRSFWVGGQTMAVCSRCFGFYSALLIGWMIIPCFRNTPDLSGKKWLLVLVAVAVINFIDITANVWSIWHNTLVSRLLVGAIPGIVIIFILNQIVRAHYGRANK